MNTRIKETSAIETPTLPPAAGIPPDRPQPAPPKQAAKAASPRAPLGNPCASLTPAAIQAVINKIIDSRKKAAADSAANGVNGVYASAARDNLTYLTDARDKMLVLQAWLKAGGIDSPFVTNTTGAYNVHGYVRETVFLLHYARHWCMISASYHRSANARSSYELTTHALELIEPLGGEAGRCYMQPYGPFTKP